MSLGYSITANLDLNFTKEKLYQILKNAEKIGCSFFLTNIDELDPENYQKINITEAIRALYEGIPDPDMHIITLKYESMFVNLSAIEHADNTITIMLTNFKYPWLYSHNGKMILNMVKYAKFFLEIIDECPLLTLLVEKN